MKNLSFIVAATALMLAACSDTDTNTTSSVEHRDTAPQIDADPTPQTGTGGASQTNSLDGTVNGAPGQPRPAQ